MAAYYKSLLHQMRGVADAALLDSNAPSIFDFDEFSKPLIVATTSSKSSTPASTISIGTSVGSSSNSATGKSIGNSFDTGAATKVELNAHINDSFAHQSLFIPVNTAISNNTSDILNLVDITNSLSGTLSGTILDVAAISGSYLVSDNLIAGTNILITSGTDSQGRSTKSVGLDIQRGITAGSINGIISNLIDTGVSYSPGKVFTASLANVVGLPSTGLCLETFCTNGSNVTVYVKSGFSGTSVNANFDIHWIMI